MVVKLTDTKVDTNMQVKIYLITNMAVDPHMYYVGMTRNTLEQRLQEHISIGKHEGNKLLSDAIIEYGKRNFSIEVLEEVDVSISRIKEDEYIRIYRSHYMDKCGYNMRYETDNYEKHYHGADISKIEDNLTNGKIWNYGIKFSQQSKEKMSKTKKYRRSIGLYDKFNTNHTEETKNKISKSKTGQKLSQNHKNKISECSLGRSWIYNENTKERKFLKRYEIDTYLLNGWKSGKGVVWMNNTIQSVCVDIWDYENYTKVGFIEGRLQCSKKS